MKTRTMYMHTLNGQPAIYCRGETICFARVGRYDRSKGIPLVNCVATIKSQQRASTQRRANLGFDENGWEYGYVRVEVHCV